MTYRDGYQDGAMGQAQRQRRRPYATGFKAGKAAFDAEMKKLNDAYIAECVAWCREQDKVNS